MIAGGAARCDSAVPEGVGSRRIPNLKNSHREAVIRVIEALRESANPTMALGQMARIALISRFHFDRLFRQVVGIPPRQFQSALRIASAKRLLLTSDLTALDVCMTVGYNSLGTFTRRFAQMVGTPPTGLRRLVSGAPPERAKPAEPPRAGAVRGSISGILRFPGNFEGFAMVGLFDTPVPQGNPRSCAVVTADSPGFTLCGEEGDRYVLAAAMSTHADSVSVLLNQVSFVGRSEVQLRSGDTAQIEIRLRPMEITDPPIITAVAPFVLRQLLAEKARP
jgi:AraC family transcriptional regulator